MAEKKPRIDQEFLDNYWDPEDVDLPPDHPIAKMYRGQRVELPKNFRPPPPGVVAEYERVDLGNGEYEVIEVILGRMS